MKLARLFLINILICAVVLAGCSKPAPSPKTDGAATAVTSPDKSTPSQTAEPEVPKKEGSLNDQSASVHKQSHNPTTKSKTPNPPNKAKEVIVTLEDTYIPINAEEVTHTDASTMSGDKQVPVPTPKSEKAQIPNKVEGVTAIPGDKSVTVSWNLVDGADGYCIYKHNGTEFKSFKFSDKSSKKFGGIENDVEYQFAVAAYFVVGDKEIYGPMSDAVSVTPSNSSVEISTPALVLSSGEEHQLNCTLNNEVLEMTWESSDTSVATVDKNGVVSALSKGTAKITAKRNKTTRSCVVHVDRKSPEPTVSTDSRYTKRSDGTYTNNQTSHSANIMFTGDLMALKPQMLAAKQDDGTYDFYPSFCKVAPIFKGADLVVGNLETTLSQSFPYSEDSINYMGISNCNAPSSYLDALKKAGFDALMTANNHYCDSGKTGIIETIEHLDKYNFMRNGTYKNADESRVVIADVNGMRVGILNYNQKSTNGKDSMLTEKEKSTMLGKFYRTKVPKHIKTARDSGAEFIIVVIHYGTQNSVEVNESQQDITQYIADCGADLIVGSHPHLLQKYDTVTSSDGRVVPVAYSLGNFCSHMTELERNTYNVIFKVNIRRENGKVSIGDVSYVPCCILGSTPDGEYVITPTSLTAEVSEEQKRTLEKAHNTIVETIGNKISPVFE